MLVLPGHPAFAEELHEAERISDAGGELFTYEKGGKPVELSYLTVPDDAAKHVDEMRPWTDMAIVIANRTQTRKKPRKS